MKEEKLQFLQNFVLLKHLKFWYNDLSRKDALFFCKKNFEIIFYNAVYFL